MSTLERSPDRAAPSGPDDERDRAAYHALLRTQKWEAISRRLTAFAYRLLRGRSWQDAEEIAQDAIALLCDPSRRRWDAAACPDVFGALAPLVVGLVSNRRQKKASRAEILHEDLEQAERSSKIAPRDPRTPEDAVAKAERARFVAARLRARVADDPVAREVVTCVEEGVDGRQAQCDALGRSVEEVKNARRRITHHLAVIERELDEGPEDRRG